MSPSESRRRKGLSGPLSLACLTAAALLGGIPAQAPGPQFSTFLGGSGIERAFAIACHGDLVLVVGQTESPNFAGPPLGGTDDAYVVLLDLRGCGNAALLWARRLGGSADEVAFDAKFSGSGPATRITVVGHTRSSDFPVTANGLQPVPGGGMEGFVTQLDLQGNVTWSTFFGGTGHDRIAAVSVDAATGEVTVAGYSNSTGWLPSPGGQFDAFVARIDPAAGSSGLRAGRLLGGTLDEGLFDAYVRNWDLMDLHVASDGTTTLAGVTGSTNFPVVGAFQSSFGGVHDPFVARLDPTLTTVTWSTYLGQAWSEGPSAIAVDAGGVVTVGIVTNGPFWTTPGCYDATYGGTRDGVIAQLDPSRTGPAQLRYATYIGDVSQEYIGDLAVDSSGIVTACGPTWNTGAVGWTGTPGSWISAYPNGGTGFVLRLEPLANGSRDLHYLSFVGAGSVVGGWEGCNGVALAADGRVVLSGATDNPNYPARCAPQPWFGGGPVDSTVVVLDLLPDPVRRYGASSPACRSPMPSQVNSQPFAGNASFQLLCSGAVSNAAGALFLGLPTASAVPIVDVDAWLAPLIPGLPVTADGRGLGRFALPVPNGPQPPFGLAAQWLWLVPATCGRIGLEASDALRF